MSDERNDGSSGSSSPPSSGSSLADAVVAALAKVQQSSRPPPEAAGPAANVAVTGQTVVAGGATRADDTQPVAVASPPPEDEPTAPVEAGSTESSATESSATESSATEPSATEPSATESSATEPSATEPSATEPAATTAGSTADASAPAEEVPAEVAGGAAASASAATVDEATTTVVDEAAEERAAADANAAVTQPAPAGDGDEETRPRAVVPARDPADVPDGLTLHYYGRTDVGLVREHNEDNFLVANLSAELRGAEAPLRTPLESRGIVLAVCDGMGGAAAGEVASQMAVDTVYEVLQAGGAPRDRDRFARRLVRCVEEAGSRIFSAAKMDRTRRGMGTTATVAGLVDDVLFVGQVGDSRAYVLRGDQFGLITKDQSLVNQLIEAGQLTEEEAEAFEHSNIILQALGTTEEVTVDLTFLELRRGDRLLVCSDGLSGLVHGDMLKEVLRSTPDLVECAQQLIAMANAGGGHDNITVVLADFDGKDLKEPTEDARVAYQQYPLPPEDPKDAEPLPSRTTSKIKSIGAPKPGADVKGESGGATLDTAEPESGGKWWLFALVLFAVVVLVAAVVLFMDDGTRSDGETEGGAAPVTISSSAGGASAGAAPAAPVAAAATLRIRSDLEGGDVWVDGRPSAPLRGGVTEVSLTPGEHRVELRDGEARVAEQRVTLAEGEVADITLSVPVGASPEVPPSIEELGVVVPAQLAPQLGAPPLAPLAPPPAAPLAPPPAAPLAPAPASERPAPTGLGSPATAPGATSPTPGQVL